MFSPKALRAGVYVAVFNALIMSASLAKEKMPAADDMVEAAADAASFDGLNGQVSYMGNARLFNQNMRIDADHMSAEQDDNGNTTVARLTGNPARLTHIDPVTGVKLRAEAGLIIYSQLTGHFELRGKAHLTQDDDKLDQHTLIDADSIRLQEKNKVLVSMEADGGPARFERRLAGAPPYTGQALAVRYQAEGELLLLQGDARLSRGATTIEHQEIRYDGVNKRTEARKIEGKQVHFTRRRDEATNKNDGSLDGTANDKTQQPR